MKSTGFIKKQSEINDKIIAIASSANGFISSDIPGESTKNISARCCRLVEYGRLFRVAKCRGLTRFFSTQEAADLFVKHERRTAPPPNVKKISLAKITFKKDASVIITPSTIYTVYPTQNPRFTASSFGFIHSANRCGRVYGDAV